MAVPAMGYLLLYPALCKLRKIIIPKLSLLSTELTVEGQNLTGGDTDRGYNLRSQGPATLGVEALDK